MLRRIIFLACIVIAGNACSLPFSSSGATPETKATVLAVASNYLNAIVQGDERSIVYMIDWPSYMEQGGQRITREEYLVQLRNIQSRWSPEVHPLVGLRIEDVRVRENDAWVEFTRPSKSFPAEIKPYRSIEVQLLWNGNGWIVRRDSMFGRGKLFSELPPKQTSGQARVR